MNEGPKGGRSPSAIDGLIESGLLKHGIALTGLEKLFLPDDIDAFLADLISGAKVVDSVPEGSFPIRSVCNKAKLTSTDLLPAQIAGRFGKVSRLRGTDGLPGLLFDLAEVPDVFEAEGLSGLTRDDLRKQLHINSSTVSLLLKRGLIGSREVRDPSSRQSLSLVEPRELDRFLEKYTTLGLIAHQLGTQARHVAARLDKDTVRPLRLPVPCSKNYLRKEVALIIAI